MKEIVKVLTLKLSSVGVGERQERLSERDAGRHLI